MNKPFVAVLMETDADVAAMQPCIDILKQLEVKHEVKITSAQRTPAAAQEFVQNADERGCAVFICAASLNIHLAATVAGLTLKPVIAAVDTGCNTQMPSGLPVATVVGEAKNAGFLAAQILATTNIALAQRLRKEREEQAKILVAKDAQLQFGL